MLFYFFNLFCIGLPFQVTRRVTSGAGMFPYWISSVCRSPNPVRISSFLIFHRVFNKSKTTSGAEPFYRSTWAHLCFCGVHIAQSLVFCVMFCRSLFVVFVLYMWPLYCMSFYLPFFVNLFSSWIWLAHCFIDVKHQSATYMFYYFILRKKNTTLRIVPKSNRTRCVGTTRMSPPWILRRLANVSPFSNPSVID